MPEGNLTPPEVLRAAELTERYGTLDGTALMLAVLKEEFPGTIALVSSFGTESAVLLALAAEVDPAVPVIFVDTGKLFGETLRYRDQLVTRLGLTDVRTVGAGKGDLAAADKDGLLWQKAPDACCHLRKTLPLRDALHGFEAWITGRKRFQASTRAAIPLFETQDRQIKVNPLALWDRERLDEEFARRDLPRHPLEEDGFLSIGCYTCTERVAPGADPRSGRWAGLGKTECGIHTTNSNYSDAWTI
ncbi:phosphoadenylyl-sulfate reductase [Azospirillum sp.]|uniref:phosphoadenylyl-sulfate reductase n=1 Tax=Azospirillum sp. TaxID=34012 RepID=UPI003D72F7F0